VKLKENYMLSAQMRFAACAAAVALYSPMAGAADIGGDLKATIVLQGYACSDIAQKTRKADSDYNVTCKDGNHYHVYINAQGRVVVEKA
jgi:hypothetical protein